MRNDGDTFYFLLTDSGDQYGSWNNLRPFSITNNNGIINIGTPLYLNASMYCTGYQIQLLNNSNSAVAKLVNYSTGTTDTIGESGIEVGNLVASGVNGNSRGRIRIYSTSASCTELYAQTTSANISINLPGSSGTLCLDSHNHNTQYAFGDGSGRGTMIALPRTTEDDLNIDVTSTSDSEWGLSNKAIYREYAPTVTNIPSNAWYHILTAVGSDRGYATQLALGMTSQDMYYRNRSGGIWYSWNRVYNAANSNSAIISSSSPADSHQLWAY